MNFGNDAEFDDIMIQSVENKDASNWPKLDENVTDVPDYTNYTYYGQVQPRGKYMWPIGWGILRHNENGLKIACKFTDTKLTPHKHVIFAFPNGLRFTAETMNKFQIIKITKILKNGDSPLESMYIQPFIMNGVTQMDENYHRAVHGTDPTQTDLKFPTGIAPAAGGSMRRKRKHRSRRGRSRKSRSRRSRRT